VNFLGKNEYDFIYDYPNPIVMFIHGDADGLAAGALLVREFERRKMEYQVVITQPFSLKSALYDFGLDRNYIIIDLAISPKTKNSLLPGTLVIDHHPDTLAYEKELRSKGIFTLIDTTKSASMLVYSILPKTKQNKYLSKLGAAGDRVIEDEELGRQASVLAASMGLYPKDDWMRYYILGCLVEGKSVWEMKEVKARSKMAFAKLDEINDDYTTLFENDDFVVRFYKDGYGFAGKLANKLHKETKKVAFATSYLHPDSPEVLVTGRTSTRGKYDLQEIFLHFKDWGGYGGGHKGAASGVVPKDKFMDFIFLLEELSRGE
jgi:hypothetical protein